MLSTIFSTLAAKIAAIGVAAAAAAGGVAATGSLPAPAQDAVATAFSHLGVHFPPAQGASSSQGETSSTTETSTEVETNDADEDVTTDDANNEHGKEVSEAAHATYDSGREKGEAVSNIASTNGQEHRSDNANPGGNKPETVPPASGADDHPTPDNHPGNGPPEGVGKP